MSEKTVLIVEDDKEAVEMYVMFFESQGFEIVGKCDNGKEAIKIMTEKQPKAVLLDIGLKGELTGLDVLKEVANLLNISKVIVVSAYPEHEEKSISLGAFGFIKKPVLAQPLKQKFNEALNT